MLTGKVKWFNDQKGYGFIVSDKVEYFVHFKEIQSNGFKTLKEGQTVTFNPTKSQKGHSAINVNIES